jgi:hypothetical protein
MGLRRLLARKPAEVPLERLAELGREQAADHPTRPVAQPDNSERRAPVSLVAIEKKGAEFGRPAFRREGRRPNYVWLSEKSRRARTGWADQLFRPF